MVGWQFSGTQNDLCSAKKITRRFTGGFPKTFLRKRPVRLCRTARDSEFVHSQLQGRPFHREMCCCSVGASHNPIALLESFQNLLAFRFLQKIVERAICRFLSSDLFNRNPSLGKFKIGNIDTQHRARRNNHGALDDILEFSYVPRPMIAA